MGTFRLKFTFLYNFMPKYLTCISLMSKFIVPIGILQLPLDFTLKLVNARLFYLTEFGDKGFLLIKDRSLSTN